MLGTAAFLDGYYAQDFPLYGAERRGAPIAAYTRIAAEPIMERGVIAEPDIVIIMDKTLLYDPRAMPLSGLKKGGIVFINTPQSPEEAKAEYKIRGKIITLDITRICLEILKRTVISSLAGAVAARIAGLSEDSLNKAVETVISEIVTDRVVLEKNIEAALYCFNAIPPVKLKTAEARQKESHVISVPFETAEVSSPTLNVTGTTPLRKTGNWRVFRPVWDYEACNKCLICVARCPEGCILVNEDGFPYVDYENCKGCLICVEECPKKTLGKEREVQAESREESVQE